MLACIVLHTRTKGDVDMKRIELYRQGTSWMARFINDESIVEAFGTDTLPTSFMSGTPSDVVLERVKEMNPEHEVVLRRAS
jgi:hypothetical protein